MTDSLPPSLFATCPPGMETVLDNELASLGFRSRKILPGGVQFRGSPLRANRMLTTAHRVLLPVARFDARDFDALVAGAEAVDWAPYGGLTPRVSAHKSRLYHTGAIAEWLGAVVPAGEGTLYCRLMHDRCTLQVDTTGAHLHQRGWREETGPAPLRETLAAQILALVGWSPGTALVDPFCGSGTFAIEAATAASGQAPGRLRTFSCEKWWRSELMPRGEAVPTLIRAGDRSKTALATARRNAERAGVTIDWHQGQAHELQPPAETGLLVTNPPYGHRAADAAEAWDQLGVLLRGPFANWQAAVLSPDRALDKRLKREVTERMPLQNGGLRIDLLRFDP
jgi:23S rRNA G2445 N2-methylase RlmL